MHLNSRTEGRKKIEKSMENHLAHMWMAAASFTLTKKATKMHFSMENPTGPTYRHIDDPEVLSA